MNIGAQLTLDGFGLLPLELAHVDALATLKGRTSGSFDRMLVAQALVEGLTLVTGDRQVTVFGVPYLAATVEGVARRRRP